MTCNNMSNNHILRLFRIVSEKDLVCNHNVEQKSSCVKLRHGSVELYVNSRSPSFGSKQSSLGAPYILLLVPKRRVPTWRTDVETVGLYNATSG